MKRTLILLSIVALSLAKIIPGSQEDDTVDIQAAQNYNNYYNQNLMNLSPSEREMLGLSMNRDFAGYPNDQMMGFSPLDQMMMQGQYPSMDFMNYPGMNMGMYPGMGIGNYPGMGMNSQNMGMGGNYPNMMMPNFNSYPGYPSQYQGAAKTNACGCTSTCGMPCLWWSCTPCVPCPNCPEETTLAPITTTLATLPTVPQELETTTLPPSNSCPCIRVCPPCLPWFPCNPCSCPCQTTPSPDNNTPEPTTTTLEPTTTTLLTTVTQEITQTPPNNCIPCQPCMPCGPIWWMPCSPCSCNNGCQTSAPITTTSTVAPLRINPPRNNVVVTNNNPSNRNNCQCICAPCPPWQDCPPCPKNCPCY